MIITDRYDATNVGQVIDWSFDVDDMVIFKVVWYGKPGFAYIRADLAEVFVR